MQRGIEKEEKKMTINWATGEFDEIYLKGDETFIREVLEFSRQRLGKGCQTINLEPKFQEEENEN
jgi:hypothetical protein